MIRIIAAVVTVLVLCGCRDYEYTDETRTVRVEEHMYKEHRYLRFKDCDYGCTYIHDPDCPKCAKGGEK